MLGTISLRFALGNLLVAGALAVALVLSVHTVISTAGEREVGAAFQRTAQSMGNHLKDRIASEMGQRSMLGTPPRDLVARQTRQALESFSGYATVFKAPLGNGEPLMTTLDQAQLADLLNSRTQIEGNASTYRQRITGVDYFVQVQPLSLTSSSRPDLLVVFMLPTKQLTSAYSTIRYTVVGFAALIAVLLAVYGYWLGMGIGKRLKRVTATVYEAEQGLKPSPLPAFGLGEEVRLAAAINSLIQGPSEKDKVRQEANTDALTGLANRRALVSALDDVMGGRRGRKSEASLMFLDLDGFKPINDTYGHDVGDEVLREVAKRLETCVRDNDVICRLGGDEFVLMFNGLTERKALEERAAKVLDRINEPYWVGDNRVTMGVSIGISIGPADGKTGEDLLTAADEAMYAAKKTGKNQFTFYS